MEKGFITLLLLLITALPACGAPVNSSGPWGVDIASFTSLSTAKRSPVTAGKTMVVTGVMNCNTLTIPADRAIEIKLGGKIRYSGHLHIAGPFTAGQFQVLEKVGSGYITFDPAMHPDGIPPEWWPMDGTNDQIAINAAVDAVKPAAVATVGDSAHSLSNGAIRLTKGKIYHQSGKIKLYNGMRLTGGGVGTFLWANTGYPDPMQIELQFNTTYLDCRAVDIGHIQFVTQNATDIAAVMPQQIADPVGNGLILAYNKFHDLQFFSSKGVILTNYNVGGKNIAYSQGNEFSHLSSLGWMDQILKFAGNANIVNGIKVDNMSGDSADPWVHLTTYYMPAAFGDVTLRSSGNSLKNMILEGNGSVNKTPLRLEKANQTDIENLWIESMVQSNFIEIEECNGVNFKGNLNFPSVAGKMKIRKSSGVNIETFTEFTTTYKWFSHRIDMDSASNLNIDTLRLTTSLNPYPMVPNLRIGKIIDLTEQDLINSGVAAQVGHISEIPTEVRGANLLTNPRWASSGTGWTYSTTPTIATYTTSDISSGKMAHFNWASPVTNEYFEQAVTIPAGWVGRVMDIEVLIKITGLGIANPQITGVGLGGSGFLLVGGAYNFPTPQYEDWQRMRISFKPQSAGTMNFRINIAQLTAASHVYVDKVHLGLRDDY